MGSLSLFSTLPKVKKQKEIRRYIQLCFHSPGVGDEVKEFPQDLICFGYGSHWGVDLLGYTKAAQRHKTSSDFVFSLALQNGQLRIESKVPLLISGVERKTGKLRPGETFLYKNLKIRFCSLLEREEASVSVPSRALQLKLPKFSFPSLRGWGTLKRIIHSLSPSIALALSFGILGILSFHALIHFLLLGFPVFLVHQNLSQPTSSMPFQALSYQALGEHEQEQNLFLTSLPIFPPISETRAIPLTIAPGEPLPDRTVDILCIHAHPDDEALDLAVLLAQADLSGLSCAQVLLTDGEGGIYQSDYAGPHTDLCATRIAEAQASMAELGVDFYIRMGFRNHPYNGTGDMKDPEDILRIWGGEGAIDKIAGLLRSLCPAIVVAPDGPSGAREHFEHEAAGLLVKRALSRLDPKSDPVPKGFLRCVDPRQTQVYRDLIGLPRKQVMDRQRAALASHRTQADASYFGLLMIEDYPQEWYKLDFWTLDEDPHSYFISEIR